jgi:rubrerythrin
MSFETLKNIIEFNKSQPSSEQEDLENNECPVCYWTLKANSENEKSCPICGRVYKC